MVEVHGCLSLIRPFSPYLFVLLVCLLRDLLGLSELRLERRRPVVLHVGLVLQGLAYPELGEEPNAKHVSQGW